MNEVHKVDDIVVKGTHLHIVVDGDAYDIDLVAQSARLRRGTEAKLKNIEVSPSGYGLYWPELDEDLSIDGLIGVVHESPLLVAESHVKYGKA
jgi:hypothetical protein